MRRPFRSKRSVTTVVAAVALGAIATGALSWYGDGATAGPRATEFRTPPDEQDIRDHLEGDIYVNPSDPPTSDRSLIQRHGPFTIVPSGFVGEVAVEQVLPLPANRGTATNDPASARASSLYVDVPGIPEDLRLTRLDTHDATSELIIRQEFESLDRSRSLEVTRRRVPRLPIVEIAPPEGGALALSLDYIEGIPALVWQRPPGGFPEPYTVVRFVTADIETLVVGTGTSVEEVLSIARTLAKTLEDK